MRTNQIKGKIGLPSTRRDTMLVSGNMCDALIVKLGHLGAEGIEGLVLHNDRQVSITRRR